MEPGGGAWCSEQRIATEQSAASGGGAEEARFAEPTEHLKRRGNSNEDLG